MLSQYVTQKLLFGFSPPNLYFYFVRSAFFTFSTQTKTRNSLREWTRQKKKSSSIFCLTQAFTYLKRLQCDRKMVNFYVFVFEIAAMSLSLHCGNWRHFSTVEIWANPQHQKNNWLWKKKNGNEKCLHSSCWNSLTNIMLKQFHTWTRIRNVIASKHTKIKIK